MTTTHKNKSLIIDAVFSLLSTAMLVYFAIPKVTSSEMSLKGFSNFSPALGLDPLPFMLFTGYLEFAIAAIFVVGLILLRTKPLLLWIANFLLLGTMATALFIELFARTQAVGMLVVIAIVFAAMAVIQLVRHLSAVGSLMTKSTSES